MSERESFMQAEASPLPSREAVSLRNRDVNPTTLVKKKKLPPAIGGCSQHQHWIV